MGRHFSASTHNVSVVGHAAIDGLTTLTVAQWWNAESLGGGNVARMMVKGDGTTYEWQAYISNARLNFEANRWGTTDGVWRNTSSLGASFNFSIWNHFAVSYDFGSTANNPVMYFNGTPFAVTRDATPAGSDTGAVGDLIIGNNKTSSGTLGWFGWLEENAVWDRILSAGEVLTAMHAGPFRVGGTGLVSYVPNMGQFSPEPNYSPQGDATRNGTVSGTAVTSNSGRQLARGWGYHLETAGGALGGVSSSTKRSFAAGMVG